MDVLYVVSEAYPFAKEGGVGEVAGAFPAALAEMGVDVRVILPLYDSIPEEYRAQLEFMISYPVQLALETVFCGLYRMRYADATWYFIENSRCFSREKLYGYKDDDMRFAFFSKAVCASLRYLEWRPEIIHCNDWQTALVPIYLSDYFTANRVSDRPKTVFTIHNVEFQGDFSYQTLTDVFGLSGILFAEGTLELGGSVNLMKGAIETADILTTVSPTYAQEITAPDAAGPLAEVISSHAVYGIRNGIPADSNPAVNKLIHRPYDAGCLTEKSNNKFWLQDQRGLKVNQDAPVFGCVSRLLPRKGFDLIQAVLPGFLARGAQLVLTGDGDPEIVEEMRKIQLRFPDQVAILPFSEQNAVEIFSSADFLLMPSLEEPCGTAQMQEMQFGTVPIVRATGGLKDTVPPYDAEHLDGCGFVFTDYSAAALEKAMEDALLVFQDSNTYTALQLRCMARDVSWEAPAAEYKALYKTLIP